MLSSAGVPTFRPTGFCATSLPHKRLPVAIRRGKRKGIVAAS
jgi:hypothetical protein